MVWLVVALLAPFLIETHAYQPKFKVFEIRKAKDHDQSIDFQYYDPDFMRIQTAIRRETDNKKLVRLANDIVKRLEVLSQRAKKNEMDTSTSESGPEFVDETRSLLVIPSEDVVYNARPDTADILQKLIQSAQRTSYNNDDVEDKLTAAPIRRIPDDNDD